MHAPTRSNATGCNGELWRIVDSDPRLRRPAEWEPGSDDEADEIDARHERAEWDANQDID